MTFTFATAFTILSLLASSLASPLPDTGITIPLTKKFVNREVDSDGAADLPWVLATTEHIANKYHATLSAFETNHGKPLVGMTSIADRTASRAAKNEKRASAGEALIDEQSGSFWQGSISIGTPAQTFNMDFDTGSSDLWVPAPSAGTSGNTYTPSKSSTAVDQGRTFSISYGDGSTTSGEVYKDSVTIAGLKATGQGVGYATSVSTTTGATFDGLVGMGYQSLSTERLPPYFATLLSEGVVSTGKFAFRLATSGSELYLGGVDSAKYSGSITYTPVTQQAYWQVALGAVKVNSKSVITGTSAIIDTGTTLIYAPTSVTSTFYADYPNATPLSSFGYNPNTYAGYYAVPCTGTSYVSLTFGGASHTIPTSIFTSQGTVGSKGGVQYCLGGLIGTDSNGLGSTWLVGDIFLQSVYSVFDLTNNQVGFATPR